MSLPVPRRFILGAIGAGAVVGLAAQFTALGRAAEPRRVSLRFSRGVTFAPGEVEALRGALATAAADPDILFRITGHTGAAGDPAANLALSTQRAEAVRAVLVDFGIAPERITWAGGVGGADPLPRPDGTSDAGYQRLLARATIDSVRRR